MSIEFHHAFFQSMADVLDDIKTHSTWPTTYVSGPSEGLEPHWHAHDVHAYIMEGSTDLLDAVSGQRTPVSAGDKVFIPAGTVHAEGQVRDRVVYVIAVPEALGPDDFLKLEDPTTLNTVLS